MTEILSLGVTSEGDNAQPREERTSYCEVAVLCNLTRSLGRLKTSPRPCRPPSSCMLQAPPPLWQNFPLLPVGGNDRPVDKKVYTRDERLIRAINLRMECFSLSFCACAHPSLKSPDFPFDHKPAA